MKFIRLIIAIIAALWTAGVAVGVVREFGTHQGVRGTTQIFAGVGVTVAFLVITISLFKWALRPQPVSGKSEDQSGSMRKLLYVGNIPDNTAAADLEPLFKQHGTVVSAQIIADRRTGRSLGFGFVEMTEGAEAAIRVLHGTQFQGRRLTVRWERNVSEEHAHDDSPEFRKTVDDLREQAGTGDPEAARELADILYFPGPFYDPQAAYKWYYIALSQQGYTVNWDDHNHTPPHYCGPVGDFRNECMVSDLVVQLGWERIRQLDKEAADWMAQRNLTNRRT